MKTIWTALIFKSLKLEIAANITDFKLSSTVYLSRFARAGTRKALLLRHSAIHNETCFWGWRKKKYEKSFEICVNFNRQNLNKLQYYHVF